LKDVLLHVPESFSQMLMCMYPHVCICCCILTILQVGFFDIVIIPLFHTFGKVFGNCRPLLTYVMRNYRYWADLQAQQALAEAVAAGSSSSSSSALQAKLTAHSQQQSSGRSSPMLSPLGKASS
jgi:hypothetical protein